MTINDQVILETGTEKSLRALLETAKRKIKDITLQLAESIEIKDLACSNANFVNVLEFLNSQIPEPHSSATL